ncbi:MAG: POTRA domain-containing protein, partial [Candidatus Latescibacteria bacterium]|nr:POTRA domain-containing protein [Candidatus Latescibacterota bacterium]
KTWLVTRQGMAVDSLLLRRDIRRILEGYRDRGLWKVGLAFPEIYTQSGDVIVEFQVTENSVTRVDSIQVIGDLIFEEGDVRTALGFGRGAALVTSDLNQKMNGVLGFYENRGYPFCELRPSIQFTETGALMQVEVIPGAFVRIDTVQFEGNAITQTDVLMRHLPFSLGEAYDQRKVDAFVAELRRLAFLEDVEMPKIEMSGKQMALVVGVREARNARIEGGVGVAPGSGGAGQILTGAVELEVLNFAGGGREGRALWSRRGVDHSTLFVHYREPWILNSPVSGWAEISMTARTGYVTHRFGGGIDLSINKGGRIFGGLIHNRVLPDSVGLGEFEAESMWALEAGLEMDRRDDRWNPVRGWRAKVLGEVGESTRGFTRRRWTVDGQVFWPLGRRSTLSLRGRGLWVSQAEGVPESAWIRVGGAQSLRGFQEEAFLGTRAGWANFEWRLLLGPRARIFAFVDAGGIGGVANRTWPVAYGVGILADARMGVVGVDYGLARGEGVGRGMVHVR